MKHVKNFFKKTKANKGGISSFQKLYQNFFSLKHALVAVGIAIVGATFIQFVIPNLTNAIFYNPITTCSTITDITGSECQALV